MTLADTDSITATVLEYAAHGDVLHPVALTFLLRQYRATGRPDVSDMLGEALALALARHVDHRSTSERAGWLLAFTEATAVSDDERLADAARDLIQVLAGEWPSIAVVDQAAASVDACLHASHLVDAHDLVPRAIDELERIVAGAYRPGHGVAHTIDPGAHVRGGARDHLHTASALLSAYELTGRLPYSMLAEELVQASRQRLSSEADFGTSCEAARVLCRLAALHDDASYRKAAVIAADADYRADAGRLLTDMAARLGDAPADAALYGLAFDEWRDATPR